MTHANPQLSTAFRPRVGIPWRTSNEEANHITNKLQYYFAAVKEAAGEPIAVSLQLGPQKLAAQIQDLDAFVLPGGPADVNPSLYHATRHQKTRDADSNREKTDFAILDHAFASGKPVLAICYGCQSLNVCLGGSLYQDIASELHSSIEHSKEGLAPDAPACCRTFPRVSASHSRRPRPQIGFFLGELKDATIPQRCLLL